MHPTGGKRKDHAKLSYSLEQKMKTWVGWHCQEFAFAKIVDITTAFPLINELKQVGFC